LNLSLKNLIGNWSRKKSDEAGGCHVIGTWFLYCRQQNGGSKLKYLLIILKCLCSFFISFDAVTRSSILLWLRIFVNK
jgi:hypothetical protein